jgi:hypothetical protein
MGCQLLRIFSACDQWDAVVSRRKNVSCETRAADAEWKSEQQQSQGSWWTVLVHPELPVEPADFPEATKNALYIMVQLLYLERICHSKIMQVWEHSGNVNVPSKAYGRWRISSVPRDRVNQRSIKKRSSASFGPRG